MQSMTCTVFSAMQQGPRAAQEDCIINGRGLCQEKQLKDCAEFVTDRLLLAVCDGMGGHEHGEEASRFVCHELKNRVADAGDGPVHLSGILRDIQASACRHLHQNCGTTIAGLVAEDGRVFIFNAGDSRVYKISKEGMHHLTHDHSLVQELVEKSFLSKEAADSHPLKNLVEFGIGPVFEAAWGQHEIHMVSEDLLANATYLLCTDGLTGAMNDHEIHECLMPSPIEKGPVLAGAAAEKDPTDNASFIIVRIN
jgi:serine/threonine protein phosphatase PrpC